MGKYIKTDNSYLADKIAMRSAHLPDSKELNILDAYSSNGTIWKIVKEKNPSKVFNIARLDIESNKIGFYLKTDNARFLKSTDLNVYDVIDLDAYGIPYNQLEVLFDKSKKFDHEVGVFVTFNAVGMGMLPQGMLKCLGITRKMWSACPTLCSRHPEDKILGYLYSKGVRELYKRSDSHSSNYHCYIYFKIGGSNECPIPT